MNRSSYAVEIRHGTARDASAVLELWGCSAAAPTVTDRLEPLQALIAFDPAALLVGEHRRVIVGAVLAAWNGWRGSFYRLAVHPHQRRRGLGTSLVGAGERSLRERGALRLDAIVAPDDESARAFWLAVGYELQRDRRRFVKNL